MSLYRDRVKNNELFQTQPFDSWEPFFITEGQAQALLKIAEPLTLPYTDLQGRTVQLWKYSNLFAASLQENGMISLFPGSKIYNGLLSQERGDPLFKRLQNSSLKKWQFSYLKEQGRIFIWPFLFAAGFDRYRAAFNEALRLGTKKKENQTYIKGENQRYIEEGLHNIALKSFGKEKEEDVKTSGNIESLMGARKEARGGALIRDGKPLLNPKNKKPYDHVKKVNQAQQGIKNLIEDHILPPLRSGELSREKERDFLHYMRIASLLLDYSESYVPSKPMRGMSNSYKEEEASRKTKRKLFQMRVQMNGLVKDYNRSNPDRPMAEGKAKGDIGGVGNSIGIILGLFDNLRGQLEREHTFFLPVQGGLLLSQEEIQRLLHELALGIFVEDTVPFFSLHFNGNRNMYPVIHPVYQNTFVGYVISMLDYYMKGFLNGGFFSAEFVREWSNNPSMGRNKLKENLIDLREYCQHHLKERYLSVREWITLFERLEALESATGPKEDPILKDYSGFRSSFRIIARQKSVKKVEDLFILDGDFDVQYTIVPDPDYEQALAKHRQLNGEDPLSYRRLEKAYEKMSQQIKEMMPRIPEFKKLFQALDLINFFCSYFNTLKQANKLPLLSRRAFDKTDGCPPLFPHLPLRAFYRETVTIRLEDLVRNKKECIERGILTDCEEEAIAFLTEAIRNYILKKRRYPISKEHQGHDWYREAASAFFKNLKKTCLEARKKQLEECDALIEKWQSKHSEFSSSPREEGKERELEKCNELLKFVRARRLRLKEHPLGVLDLKTSIDFPIDSQDSILHLYSEHKLEEEKQLQKRIVGGCGIALESQPIQIDPMADPLLNRHFGDLSRILNGEILEVSHEGNKGALFKLCFTDFPLIDAEAKRAAFDYFSYPKGEGDPGIRGLYEAIEIGDVSLFETRAKAVTSWDFRDSLGRSLLHDVARGASVPILKCVSERVPLMSRDVHGFTALHEAAQEGNVEGIQFLLSKEPALIDVQGSGGETALYLAVQCGQEDVVRLLLEKKVNPNCRTAQGVTPLMCAIQRGFVDIALQLLSHPSLDLKAALNDKTTALHLAIESIDMEPVVEVLIARRVGLNQAKWDGHTPLHLAAKEGNLRVLRALLQTGCIELDAQLKSGRTALHLAAENDQYEAVKLLLEKQANPFLFGWDRETTLICAVRSGSVRSALCLLSRVKEKSVFIEGKKTLFINLKDKSDQTALEIAAKLRIWDLWFVLFNPLTDDPKQTPLTPMDHLLLLCRSGVAFDMIDTFMQKHRLNGPEEQLKVVTTCAKNGHTVAVSLLYRGEEMEKWRDSNEWSVHDYMAKFDHINFFSGLLSDSDHFSFEEIEQWVYIAARHGSLRLLKLLFKGLISRKELSLSVKKRVLLHAVSKGQCEVVDWLVHEWLAPTSPLLGEKHAAHFAVIFGDEKMVKLLLERGASFDVLDESGLSPLHYAVWFNRKDILKFLLSPAKKIAIPKTLLHFAARLGSLEGLHFLLDFFPNLDLLHPFTGDSPLASAIKENNLQNAHLLFLRGASLTIRGPDGETPFLLSAKMGSPIFPLLLRERPSYHVTDKGEDALHLAAMSGSEEHVALLLKQKFNPAIPDRDGKTARMHAEERGFFNVCALLRGEEEQLERDKEVLVQSLMDGDLDLFFDSLKPFSLNREIPFTLPQFGRCSIPILHLINLLVSEEEKKKECFERWERTYPDSLCVKTKEGRTLLHLAAMRDEDPPFKKMDALAFDSNRVTPFHLFAGSESFARFLSVFDEIDFTSERSGVDITDKNIETALCYAIRKNRIEVVAFLLDQKANPNTFSKALMTPLGLAVEKNSLPIVRRLIEKGAQIGMPIGADRETALHLAVRKGWQEIAHYLIESGANVHQKDRKGREAIHVAAAQGNQNMVRFLYACGASLFSLDAEGNGLAYFAAQSHSLSLINFLKEQEVPIDLPKQGEVLPKVAPLHIATAQGNLPMIAQFAEHGADFKVRDRDGNSALFYATISRNAKSLGVFSTSPLMDEKEQVFRSIIGAIQLDSLFQVRLLQKELKNVDYPIDSFQGMTMLHVACQCGAVRTAHHLLKEGANPLLTLRDGTSPFELCVAHDHVDIARAIYSQVKIDVNQKLTKGQHYMHLAAKKGSQAMIAFLFLQGATLDVFDSEGNTPLHLSAKKGDRASFSLLLALGASPTLPNFLDQTALDMTQKQEMHKMMSHYQKVVADCKERQEGRLHRAVRLGKIDALQVLVQVEDLHQRNNRGRTPVHVAVEEKNLPALRCLFDVEITPDLEVEDREGKTPLSIAMAEVNDDEIGAFLRKMQSISTYLGKKGEKKVS